jgi:sigma-B regulation protein RsbU (phosphoserine phosphatase)
VSERLLELRFPARASELKRARRAVKQTLLDLGISAGGALDLVLALDEACQNVIRHAYGPEREGDIELAIERKGNELVFLVTDWAPRIDPSRVKPRDLEDIRPGGLGTFLIQEVMDSADFVEPPPGCGNLLRMVKRVD